MANVFGNQGQFTAGDISNFIAQNIGNPQAIAQAAQQYNITPGQIQQAAGYTPTQQAEYLGGAGLPSLQPLTVEQLYKDVLGRSSDTGGAQYWAQKFGPTIDPNEIAEFRAAAAPELVQNAYQNVLGRAADVPGSEYYTKQLQSGALTPDKLRETLAYGAQGLEDRLKAQAALGKDVWAPSEYLKGTSGMGYEDIINYINANIQDPVKISQAAKQYGVDPNEILQAYQSKGQSPYSLQQIQDFVTQGQAGFTSRFQDMLGSTLGSTDEQQQLTQILQAQTRNPNTSLADFYNPEKFSGMLLETIEKELRDSPVNKLQEALRLSKIAKTLLGYTDEQATDLVKKAYKGEIKKDSAEGQIYNTLLDKNNIVGSDYEKLMTYAAVNNPNAQVFKDNPMMLTAYTPLEKKTGSSGQYGYYNNAPILNADFAIKNLNDKNQIKLDLGNDTNFGWETHSKYAGEVKRGAALLGINFSDRKDVEKAIEIENGLKNGSVFQDPESNGYYKINPDGTTSTVGTVKSENTRQEYNPYSENTLQKLQQAATQIDLDPSKYKSAGDLYDAIEAKTNKLYQVTGRAIDWDPEVAKKLGITQTTTGRGGVNHASVLYRQVGDKLIPISDPKSFEFHDPNTSKGFFGDLAQGIASIPFVAEIAAMATGANPAVYAAMKGAQTAALGGKPEDILKSAGIAWLAPQVAEWAGGGIKDLLPSGTPDFVINAASNAAANVAVNAGIAALTGKDVGDAITNALSTSVVQTGVGQVPFIQTIPKEYQAIVTRAIADIALGNDIQNALQRAITTYGLKTGKEATKAAA